MREKILKNKKDDFLDNLEKKIINQQAEFLGETEKTAKDEPKKEKQLKKKNSINRELAVVSYIFVGIFMMMIGYFIYFNAVKAKDIINSPYNTRQELFEERVIRGNIYSSSGDILARTEVYEDGTENRIYPYGSMFAHVVGYSSQGRKGIESLENYNLLTSNVFIVDKIKNEFLEIKNQADTVVTTLDTNLQATAYEALGEYDGAVVVVEVSTGRILASVSKPDFNPNTIDYDWEAINSEMGGSALVNRVYQGQYPPGSTFKVITMLEYMRENPDYENYSYECMGTITIGEGAEAVTIPCYDGIVHGVQNLEQSLANSCNTSFCNIGLQLNNNTFKELTKALYFNKELPVQLSSSVSEFVLDENSSIGEIMMTAMGQGNTLVSPVHMALITAAIANGGLLMEPYLIDHIENANGDVITRNSPKLLETLLTTQEAEVLTRYMTTVVENGTAMGVSSSEYTVAGKTGSAEATEGTHSWFIGFSNVDNPDIAVCVIVENVGITSNIAVPIARQIFNAYYN